MSYVSVIVSGAASLGVLVGLISGIFFLVLTGLRWVSRVREALYDEELRRQKKILFNNANSIGSGAQDVSETKKAENGFGGVFTENGREEKFRSFQSNAGNTTNRDESKVEETASKTPGRTENCTYFAGKVMTQCGKREPSSDTVQVREFIEKMVEALIGGPLDGTTVGQLSDHSAYLDMFTKYHNLLCRELTRLGFALHLSVVRKGVVKLDSSNFSQCNLKRLIKRIVSEAMTLPNLSEMLWRQKTVKDMVNDDFKNKSYEDILATAILNKVIEHFQNRENEIIDGKPKPRPRSKNLISSPRDDDQKSNSDWSDASRSDQLSLTIEEYIEEVTTALEVSEDERSDFSDFETNTNRRIPFPEAGRTVIDGTDDENSDAEEQSSATELFTSTSSWEENWLFQKKRLPSTPNAHHPVPVPMLVPNPSEDYRALVGGVDADDLSDMSDCCDLLLDDPNAEKEPFDRLAQTECEEVSRPNVTQELDENENEKDEKNGLKEIIKEKPAVTEGNSDFSPTNSAEDVHTILTASSEAEDEASEGEMSEGVKLNSSPTSPSQKDREFSVEDFDLLQQCEPISMNEASVGNALASNGSENSSLRSSIAEREKEKWNNPVLLTDNPYSLENIEKRAQRKKNDFFRIGTYTEESIYFPEDWSSDELTKTSQNIRFTRDYYINDSKSPSGKSSSSLSRLSKEYDQVSRHSHEALSSSSGKSSEKHSRFLQKSVADDISVLATNAQKKNLFSVLRSQTVKNQHFSNVFRSNYLTDPPELKTYGKYRYGSHSLKLRPKTKEPVFRRPSIERELSGFEQKSLREDITHSLLRAKGASCNFMLNPVYKPDIQSGQAELSDPPSYDYPCDHSYEDREYSKRSEFSDTYIDPETGKLEPIVPCLRDCQKVSRISQESGYGSDSLDYSSDSLEFWRLTPPKTPEVVESSFVSLASNRKRKISLRRPRSSLSDFYQA